MRARYAHRAGDPAGWPGWVLGFGPPLDWPEDESEPPAGWSMSRGLWQATRRHASWSAAVRAWRIEHDVDWRELQDERRRRWEAWRAARS